MKTLSFKLPESLANWLEGEAKLTRRSRSAIVREALELRRHGRDRGRKTKRTMADELEDLRGSISGPTDLSTNPKHLNGFGQ
jgi:Arc/MetJ-type ribon-helix-helix transcriptional regulator